MPTHIGGTFGHEITPNMLKRYKELASGAPEEVRYWMNQLITMVEVFQQTPDSKHPGTPDPCTQNARLADGTKIPQALIIPLEDEEIRRIWEYVPFEKELAVISAVFDTLPLGKEQVGTKKVPLPTKDNPDNFYLRADWRVTDPEAVERRTAAFNLRWWAGQLCMDRQPFTHQRLWGK